MYPKKSRPVMGPWTIPKGNLFVSLLRTDAFGLQPIRDVPSLLMSSIPGRLNTIGTLNPFEFTQSYPVESSSIFILP